jgi:hypothetical protein
MACYDSELTFETMLLEILWDSYDGGSAHSKACTYTGQNNTLSRIRTDDPKPFVPSG